MASRRLHVYFSGRVQGVGFRFTAEHIAQEIPVTGFVRNLPDGRVELLLEGEEKDLENYLKRIRKSFLARYIEGVESRWLEARGEFQDFRITY